MNNKDMENKIRDAFGTNRDWTEEEWEAFHREVRQRLHQRDAETAAPSAKHRKGAGLLRAAVITLTVAAVLLIFPLVYSALTPLPTGSADSAIRSVAIWINDQLHLGIRFSEPVEDARSLNDDNSEQALLTLEEAAKQFSCPLVYFDNDKVHFASIEKADDETGNYVVKIHYVLDDGDIIVTTSPTYETVTSSIHSSNAVTVQTKIGDMYIWNSNGNTHGIMVYNGYEIRFLTGFSVEDFTLLSTDISVLY